MTNDIEKILSNYKGEISEIDQDTPYTLAKIETGIHISRKFLQELRLILRNGEFKNGKDEIKFFKRQKPYIYGRLKFYSKLYQYVTHKPMGSKKSQRTFIDSQIEKLQNYYQRNIDFVQYYRENNTILDEYYFLRGKDNPALFSDTSHFYTDSEFSTSHDNVVAKIIAYDLLLVYYVGELNRLNNNNVNESLRRYLQTNNLSWTANKIDLVELIYALHSSASINNGVIELREIAMACEKIFNIDLGNYYHTFVELRSRKSNPTKYLDKLKELLLKRMSDSDL
ncbi:RteC domain-containing protein [Allomuricauda sp. XS_ASV26]|uniref:RteC domain-containing protein n=1 Tax=Allomuricauda sp. XS_ASV26 TaxID=3241292 RepID=UPI003512255F